MNELNQFIAVSNPFTHVQIHKWISDMSASDSIHIKENYEKIFRRKLYPRGSDTAKFLILVLKYGSGVNRWIVLIFERNFIGDKDVYMLFNAFKIAYCDLLITKFSNGIVSVYSKNNGKNKEICSICLNNKFS